MTAERSGRNIRFGIWGESHVAADELRLRLSEGGQQAVIMNGDRDTLIECLVVLTRRELRRTELAALTDLANRATMTVGVEPSSDTGNPAGWPRDASLRWNGQIGDLAKVAGDLMSLVRPTGPVFSTLPMLLPTEEPPPEAAVADSREALVDRLNRSVGPRVVPVTMTLWQELCRPGRAVSGLDYDLRRLAAWTTHERSRAFINMRLARPEDVTVGLTGPLSLDDVVDDPLTRPLVMLLGEPSSGKSLQLKFYDAHAASRSIRQRSAGAVAPTTFYVALAEQPAKPNISLDWLRQRWKAAVDVARWCDLDQFLGDGGTVLLDGLNEGGIRGLALEQWMHQWLDVIHELFERGAGKVVVSCRTRDQVIRMRAPRDQPPTAVTILPLSRPDILAIAAERDIDMARRLARAFDADPGLLELYSTPFRLQTYLSSGTPWVATTGARLFGVDLSAAVVREWEQDNPHGRLIPSRQASSLDAIARSGEDPWPVLETIPLIRGLGLLARELSLPALPNGQARLAIPQGDAGNLLARAIQQVDGQAVDPQEALDTAKDLHVLRVDRGKIRFSHPSVQHLFAAVGSSLEEIVQLAEQERGGWQSAISPTGVPSGAPPNYYHHRYDELFQFSAQLRGIEVADRLLAVDPVLAARVYLSIREPDASVADRIVARLRADLDEVFVPAARSGILAALGDLGWTLPSAAEGGRGATMLVPAGLWHLGQRGEATSATRSVASEVRAIELPSFRISRFPVSNTEYAGFVADGGYEDQSLWSPEGWEWRTRRRTVEQFVADWVRRQKRLRLDHPGKAIRLLRERKATPAGAAALVRFAAMAESEIVDYARALQARPVTAPRYWHKKALRNRLQPVVGVSWFEANAFCRWLGRRLGAAVRLPSENEWEAACLHSWGLTRTVDVENALGPAFGNTHDQGWPATTPVGTFAVREQAHRQLAVEMLGNIFEWVFDFYAPGDHSRRIVKGGSWRHDSWRAHPAYRGRGDVDAQNDDMGFRYVITEGPT
ncbi:SUMF1/EgtB/PvdO family nonheme iron enzyme [Actinoplanes sp. NPDC051470]|uniref:SUMF1/EgtB/PvdO family nonheme iron enzyme n=1 Tax=Actinoplanes sp. NPDC051470 TaxID=3157224 RepID=UPI00341761CF